MTSPYTESFESFWAAYPRKTAKPTAFKAWEKNKIEGDAFLPGQIIADLDKRTRWKWWSEDKTKIPHASTWLNQRRWEDEGWQDELKISTTKQTERTYKPIDEGLDLPIWARVANTTFLMYLRSAGGFTKDELAKAVKEKKRVVAEASKALNEDLSAGTPFGECKVTFMELLLARLDKEIGRNLRYAILRGDQGESTRTTTTA